MWNTARGRDGNDVLHCRRTLHMVLRLGEGLLKRTAMAVAEHIPELSDVTGTVTVAKQVKVNLVALVCT